MKPPSYFSPYDSPIENDFAYHAVKHFDVAVDLQSQYRVETICGLFIVDFVAVSGSGRHVGFECDGKEFHNESRDEWRDAMILGSEKLDVIYRLRGADITYQLDNIFFLLSCCEAELFSERGRQNLLSLAHPEVRSFKVNHDETNLYVAFSDDEFSSLNRVNVTRRYRKVSANRRQFWKTAYQFAVDIGGGSLDSVIAKYRRGT